MAEFSEQAVGRDLLQLVARAHALLADLLSRTSELPADFARQGTKFDPVLLDFKYFASVEHHEGLIDGSPQSAALDAELRDNNQAVLQHFLKLFKGLTSFYHFLETFLVDLKNGAYLEWSLDSVLESSDGQQLLTEALTLHGLLLIILNHRLPGLQRERILVAICRYLDIGDSSLLPSLQKLCALPATSTIPSTGLLASFQQTLRGQSAQSSGPPFLVNLQGMDQYVARFPLPDTVIKALLSRLRSEDIFHQRQHFPGAEHRTTALSAQSACLLVTLLYAPHILQQDAAAMKSIVGRFFSDRWVVSIFPGFTVDVTQAWEQFAAARSALAAVHSPASIRHLAQGLSTKARQLSHDLANELSEGVLTADALLGDMPRLLRKLRDANATLRWLLLHRTSSATKKIQDIVRSSLSDIEIIDALLDTARLECLMKELYQQLMESKQGRWERASKAVAQGLEELGHLFGGGAPLLPSMHALADPRLEQWFRLLAESVRSLDFKVSAKTARKLQKMVTALGEAQQLHQVEASGLQARHFLADLQHQMQEMVRIVGINENTLATLSVIADSSYAWGLIQEYTPLLHDCVRENPQTVARLKSWFLKLRSVLELPLLRLSQVGSKDLYPVSQFYSSQLVDYIRSVLEVVPVHMFSILFDSVAPQAQKVVEVPTRLDRAAVRDQVQAEERLQLARAACQLAELSAGISSMEKMSIGVIELQAKALLEDGLRGRMRASIVGSCNGFRIENGKEAMELQLSELQTRLGALKQALDFCQDYMHVPAVQAWDEEWDEYIRECGFQEEQRLRGTKRPAKKKTATTFLGFGKQPVRAPQGSFLGRLLEAILASSDPATSMFLRPVSGWFDANGEKRIGLQLWATVRTTVGMESLVLLSRLLGVRAQLSLQRAVDIATNLVAGESSGALHSLYHSLLPLSGLPDEGAKIYASVEAWQSAELAVSLASVGQAVLLRGQLAAELAGAVRLEGGGFAGALHALDEAATTALLTATNPKDPISATSAHQDFQQTAGELSSLVALRPLLERSGLSESKQQPLLRQFEPAPTFAAFLALFTIAQLERYVYDERLAALAHRSRKGALDCAPLLVGMVTLFRHLDKHHLHTYLQVLSQYVRVHVLQTMSRSLTDGRKNCGLNFPTEAVNTVAWLEEMCHYGGVSREHVRKCLPAGFLDLTQSASLS